MQHCDRLPGALVAQFGLAGEKLFVSALSPRRERMPTLRFSHKLRVRRPPSPVRRHTNAYRLSSRRRQLGGGNEAPSSLARELRSRLQTADH